MSRKTAHVVLTVLFVLAVGVVVVMTALGVEPGRGRGSITRTIGGH